MDKTLITILEDNSLTEGTDAKMTEIGWERFGENIQDSKSALQELVKECIKTKRELVEPVTKRTVTDGDKVGIDLDVDLKGSLKFIQDNGYNQAIEDISKALRERGLL